MTEEDLAVYVEAYERTGFTGGLNWYRNIDRNWEIAGRYAGRTIDQPALFVTGSRDPVMRFAPPSVMDGYVTDLEVVVVEGAGHWVQQQRPDEVNAALLAFLARHPYVKLHKPWLPRETPPLRARCWSTCHAPSSARSSSPRSPPA